MKPNTIILPIAILIALVSQGVSYASIVEVGYLNVIVDPGNPSDGLRYLDMTYSDGLTESAALSNAQATYANARLATPTEFDDLFAAAEISFTRSITPSAAFSSGGYQGIYLDDDGLPDIINMLGATVNDYILIWTDPDGSQSQLSTRDHLAIKTDIIFIAQLDLTPSHPSVGWLIVSPVPEPSSFAMFGIAMLGLSRRRRQR